MKCRIVETRAEDRLYRHIEQYSPQTIRYLLDPKDQGDYRCFVAVSAQDAFTGLGIVDLGPLGFGPLAEQKAGCLENILVLDPYRRQRVGTALLQTVLSVAWQWHARHVGWNVDYANTTAIAFYLSNGAVFISEEDPQAHEPDKHYTVVVRPRPLSRNASARMLIRQPRYSVRIGKAMPRWERLATTFDGLARRNYHGFPKRRKRLKNSPAELTAGQSGRWLWTIT